jgi:hypothetical protein
MQLTTSIIQDILTRSSTNHNRSKEKTLNYCIKAIAVPNKELVLSTDSVSEGGFINNNKNLKPKVKQFPPAYFQGSSTQPVKLLASSYIRKTY